MKIVVCYVIAEAGVSPTDQRQWQQVAVLCCHSLCSLKAHVRP